MWLVAGWGFRAGAVQQSFASCWEQAQRLMAINQASSQAWTFAVLETKLETTAHAEFILWRAAAMPQANAMSCSESDIRDIATPSSSLRIAQRFGTGSVSEALALHAAARLALLPPSSQDIRLLLPRIVSADGCATLAIAHCARPTPSFEQEFLS